MRMLSLPGGIFNGYQFTEELKNSTGIDIVGKISIRQGNLRLPEGIVTIDEEKIIQEQLDVYTHDPLFDASTIVQELIINGP